MIVFMEILQRSRPCADYFLMRNFIYFSRSYEVVVLWPKLLEHWDHDLETGLSNLKLAETDYEHKTSAFMSGVSAIASLFTN